ncbi:MAG: glycoside hydrolase family 65, partial [Actinomycetota bacterium]|nr:glycoside hydrolase family 65 [Actinomycetota bacterium]
EERTPRWIAVAPSKQVPLLGGLQGQHISADVAWAAWQYWRWTGDDDFFTVCGADLLIETARFWASRARRRRDGRLHIARVIGPDEYHQTVDDNAFTNVLARWNLEQAANTVEYLSEIKASKDILFNLGVTHAEVRRWRRAASGLVDGFDPSTGLYEQFTGFFHLEEILAAGLAERPFPADLFLGSKRTARSQVIKQADVLMIPHMLPEVVPLDVTAANYRYYEPRTSHGSSLSPAIHALIAARIGAVDEALAYFDMAAAIDLNDEMGNAAQGIHMASLGGLWQAAVAGFGGTRVHDDALRIDPHLPERWTRLSFPVLFRGIEIHVDATANSLTVTVGDRVKIAIGDGPAIAVATGRHSARLVNGVWSRLEQVVSG